MRKIWLAVASLVLYGWGLGQGAAHFYYAAAVRSMSSNWTAFLFGALDPAGSITVDKAPGGLWPQALMVRVFGFHDWALLLPGVVAAAAAVPLLYATVRRWAGERAGLVAAVVLATTPAVAAAARVSIGDPVLVLCLVSAAYACTRALESPGFRWPALAGALLGAGFLVKMLQAWLVLPAFAAALLVGPARRRLARTGVFVVVCSAVSLSWVTIVSLVPAGHRPYFDGSGGNSPWEMVFVYNGLGRDTGAGSAPSVPFGGPPSPLRLFDAQLGGQIAWLLPAAVLLGLGAAVSTRRNRELRAGWVLWGGWFVVVAVVFSVLRGLHPYYAATLAPAVAALVGAGVRWSDRRLLAGAGLLGAVTSVIVVSRAPAPLSVALSIVVGAAALLAVFARGRTFVAALAVAGLTGPAAWIAVTPRFPAASFVTTNPVAGPAVADVVYGSAVTTPALSMMTGARPGTPVPPFGAPMAGSTADPGLLAFLTREGRPPRPYLFATTVASLAAPYLADGHSVLPMGGFTGAAPFPELSELDGLSGRFRYVLDIPMPVARSGWLARHCARVDPAAYGHGVPYAVLYDCAR